jgi:hypothetical protein
VVANPPPTSSLCLNDCGGCIEIGCEKFLKSSSDSATVND